MKKFYATTALLILLFAGTTNAQLSYGLSAGLNHSTWKGEAVGSVNDLMELSNGMITTRPHHGLFAGGFVQMPLGGMFSLQPGVYYSQKGYTLRGDLQTGKFDFLGVAAKAMLQSHYIDVPLVLKAEVAKGLQLYAGPQLSYLVRSNLKMDAGLLGVSLLRKDVDVTRQFNRADIALTGGVAYNFDNGFSISAGYDRGLSRLDKNSHLKSYNSTFKVGVGFTF